MPANDRHFSTLPAVTSPLRVLQIGAGGMGRAWLSTIAESTDVELVGLVDLDTDLARAAATELATADLPVGTDLVALAAETGAEAILDVTIPRAHHPVTMQALRAGLPVLGEKPLANDLREAFSLAAASRATRQLFMVSQSRRYETNLAVLKSQLVRLGALGITTTEMFKAPHFGGFRDEMDHPLLLDMAIHAFDTARYLTGSEPVSVYCEEFNPSWSWYRGDAALTASFELANGGRYIFTGSWCSPGKETSWEGNWRISGEHGSAVWAGQGVAPEVEVVDDAPLADPLDGNEGEGIAGALREFVSALRTGVAPSGEVHSNLLSLAMVEAAVASSRSGMRVRFDDLLDSALRKATEVETVEEVRAVLAASATARDFLQQP